MTFFGQKSTELRKKLSVTQEQVAKRIGIGQDYLSKLETGKKTLTLPMLRRCLKAYYELGLEAPHHHLLQDEGLFSLEDQMEFTREIVENTGKFEIDFSDITIIPKENFSQIAAMLILDELYPIESLARRAGDWFFAVDIIEKLRIPLMQNRMHPFDSVFQNRYTGYYKNLNKNSEPQAITEDTLNTSTTL